MTAHRFKSEWAKAWFLAAAAALAWAHVRRVSSSPAPGLVEIRYEYDMGESLRAGIQSPFLREVTSTLPLTAVVASAVYRAAGRAPRRAVSFWLRLSEGLKIVLVMALGLALGSYLGGLSSGLVFLALRPDLDMTPTFFSMPASAVLMLLAGLALVWRARANSPWRSAAVGALIGANLLARSTLAFFPMALALWEWTRVSPRRSWRAKLKLAAPLVALPCLFVLPGTLLNGSLHGRWASFEYGRIEDNVAAAALGIVRWIPGELSRVMDSPPDLRDAKSTLFWSLGEALKHPGRFLEGCARRLAWIVSLHPLLLVLAAASLILFRGRAEFQALGLLAGYYLAVHALVAGAEPFLFPLWPLLAAIAGALPLGLRRLVGPPALAPPGAGLAYVLAAVLSLASMALAVRGLWWAARFGLAAGRRSPGSEQALLEAFRREARDPWLLQERARRRLRAGDFQGAAEDLAAPWAADPQGEAMWLRALALYALGRPEALMSLEIPMEPAAGAACREAARLRLLKAALALGRGEKAWARRLLDDALSSSPSPCLIEPLYSERERELCLAMEPGPPWSEALWGILPFMPKAEKRALLREILARAEGGKAGGFSGSADISLRIAISYREMGDYAAARGALDSLLLRRPRYYEALLEKGITEFLAGSPGAAAGSLRLAVGLEPARLDAYLTLGAVLTAGKNFAEASGVYDAALAQDFKFQDKGMRDLVIKTRIQLKGRQP